MKVNDTWQNRQAKIEAARKRLDERERKRRDAERRRQLERANKTKRGWA
jgi:Skp family chaperone for outer membrane proteins